MERLRVRKSRSLLFLSAIVYLLSFVYKIEAQNLPDQFLSPAVKYRMLRELGSDLQDILAVVDTAYYKKINLVDCYFKIMRGGISNCLDSRSSYVTEESMSAKIDADTATTYIGAGLRLLPVEEGKIILLVPFTDSIAEETGIKSGDILLFVNGVNVQGLSLDSLRPLLRGPVDSTFTFTVSRKGKVITPIVLQRKVRKLTKVIYDYEKVDSVAHIYLFGFDSSAVYDLTQALLRARRESKNGRFVLDLRFNPGGFVSSGLNISSFFASDSGKTLLTTLNENKGSRTVYASLASGDFRDMPFVILTGRETTSTSELFSATIKYWAKARIVGDTTYGKGIGQQYIRLPSGNFIKLTTMEAFVGDLGNIKIDGVGVAPDYFVRNPKGMTYKSYRDYELEKAIEVLKKLAP